MRPVTWLGACLLLLLLVPAMVGATSGEYVPVTCLICRSTFEGWEVMSTNVHQVDTDFCEHALGDAPVMLDTWTCPSCGYSGDAEDFDPERVPREFVEALRAKNPLRPAVALDPTRRRTTDIPSWVRKDLQLQALGLRKDVSARRRLWAAMRAAWTQRFDIGVPATLRAAFEELPAVHHRRAEDVDALDPRGHERRTALARERDAADQDLPLTGQQRRLGLLEAAVLLKQRGEDPDARRVLATLRSAFPALPEAEQALALDLEERLAREARFVAAAVPFLEKLIADKDWERRGAQEHDHRYLLGELYRKLGRDDDARRTFLTLGQDPKTPDVVGEWVARSLARMQVRAAEAARGAPDESASAQAREWELALADLGTGHEALAVPALLALDRRLTSFDPPALEAWARSPRVEQLPDPLGPRARHALRALSYHRRLSEHLERGPAISLLLGEGNDTARSRALLELCREPFGERLGVVAERLSTDASGPVRAIAGRIAVFLNAFCGGHESSWGASHRTPWDPTPVVRRIAQRLLEDRNPAVACTFAVHDAYALEDKQVVDWMVEHLADGRQTPRVERGLLQSQEWTVGEACLFTLDAQFRFYRTPRGDEAHGLPMRRVATLPEARTPAAIAGWWREARTPWSFAPDAEGWVRAIDQVLVVTPGDVVQLDTPVGAVRVGVSAYVERVGRDEPELAVRVDVGMPDGGDFGVETPATSLGYVHGLTAGSLRMRTLDFLVAPQRGDGLRIRLRLHVAQ